MLLGTVRCRCKSVYFLPLSYQVLRLDETGAVRRLRIKRRDLLREHHLQPRDLRRIDPSIDFTKTSPSITLKEDVLLLNLGGVRSVRRSYGISGRSTWTECCQKSSKHG
jgi:hypothetical protein